MAQCLLITILLNCLLALVISYRSPRLIKDHEYAVQVHPKHHHKYRNYHYKAAKVQQANYNEYDDVFSFYDDELEMSGLKLGQWIDHSGWTTYTGLRKRTRCQNQFKALAAYIRTPSDGGAIKEAQTKDITKRATECDTKCEGQYPTKSSGTFNLYAQCMASCWYVADGAMASLSSRKFRDPGYAPPAGSTGAFENDYKHFMRYLFNALHRDDRFDEIERLYDEQQALLAEDQWPMDAALVGGKDGLPGVVGEIKDLYAKTGLGGKLFLWRGIYGFEIDPKEPIDAGEKGTILYGPSSCSAGLKTAMDAVKQGGQRALQRHRNAARSGARSGAISAMEVAPAAPFEFYGYVLRIEVPVNPLAEGEGEGKDAIRGGKDVDWFKDNFGLIDMFATKYADDAHEMQREVLLYSFPADWIKVEAAYLNEAGSTTLKWIEY